MMTRLVLVDTVSARTAGRRAVQRCMKSPALMFLLMLPLCGDVARAQSSDTGVRSPVEVAVGGVVAASVHFADDEFAPPYLSKPLGGVTPGFNIAMNVTRRRFVGSMEFGTEAALVAAQVGRLVGGAAVGRLRDTTLGALAGVTTTGPVNRVQLLGGVTRVFGGPTLDDQHVAGGRWRATLGLDGTRVLNERVALLWSFRYSPYSRSEPARFMGVGSNVMRAGMGLRLRLK